MDGQCRPRSVEHRKLRALPLSRLEQCADDGLLCAEYARLKIVRNALYLDEFCAALENLDAVLREAVRVLEDYSTPAAVRYDVTGVDTPRLEAEIRDSVEGIGYTVDIFSYDHKQRPSHQVSLENVQLLEAAAAQR